MADDSRFTLGSSSPRRSDLLLAAGLRFDVEVVDIDEAALVDQSQLDPLAAVERIARAKFAAFPDRASQPVLLTADTLVACNGTILGKPDSDQDVRNMLRHMSGQPVTVATAVCVGNRGLEPRVEVVSTTVVLRELTAEQIDRYVASGVGLDKAGGLALQAQAKPFIGSVAGCWSNVLGLPVCVATALLESSGADTEPVTFSDAARCSVQLCGSHDR